MRAVVFHGIGDIRLDTVPEPKLKERTDAIVRLTASAICVTKGIGPSRAIDAVGVDSERPKTGWIKVELKPGS